MPGTPAPLPGQAVTFACPKCAVSTRVSQVQGDRCPNCAFEFKRFRASEEQTARDYHSVLTGEKYILELPSGEGWIVAHY
jgi:hypothetical protein